ncbi:hypothetical protein TNCV_3982531 [Trichonephila clavipes]|nr:hypothetical protein TNCV_3982531 [Trichonephila clavipes]
MRVGGRCLEFAADVKWSQHASATCSPPVGATRRPSYRIVEGLQCMTSSKDWREVMFTSPILMRQLQFKDSSG